MERRLDIRIIERSTRRVRLAELGRNLRQRLPVVVEILREAQQEAALGASLTPCRASAGHGVGYEQMVEQAGKGGELATDRCTGQAASFQIGATGEHVGPIDRAKF